MATLVKEAKIAPVPATAAVILPCEAKVAAEATEEALEMVPPIKLTA